MACGKIKAMVETDETGRKKITKIIEDESFLDNVSENIEDKESTTDNEPIEEEPLEEVDESLIEEKNEDSPLLILNEP